MTRRLDAVRPLDYRHPTLYERHVFKPARLKRVQCRECRALLSKAGAVPSRWTASGVSPYCTACHARVTGAATPRHVIAARLSATWSRYAREFGATSAPALAARRAYQQFQTETATS